MKIAVTGGNGDLGSDLVPLLLEAGHSVVSIDLAPPKQRVPGMVSYQVADVADYGQVVAVLSGCDAVVHLAAFRSPLNHPAPVIFNSNVAMSYNVLHAAATLGIKRVCLASSINAIGGAFSRAPQYDYFPVDEAHPTYTEDPYSLSKWVLEQQADSFARRYDDLGMRIASLRFHWITQSRDFVVEMTPKVGPLGINHLWTYTLTRSASRACLLSLTADFEGHEPFYIVAPDTVMEESSRELAAKYYPGTPIRGELAGNSSFFDCGKAERLLGWKHDANDK